MEKSVFSMSFERKERSERLKVGKEYFREKETAWRTKSVGSEEAESRRAICSGRNINDLRQVRL